MKIKYTLLPLLFLCILAPSFGRQVNNAIKNDEKISETSLKYVNKSIPLRIFRCMQTFNIFRCMKIFILQKMEQTRSNPHSKNVTAEFLDKIFTEETNENQIGNFDENYLKINETELNDRLYLSFQRFFNNREIKMHFIPGMLIKVVPSKDNIIDLSLKKGKIWVC